MSQFYPNLINTIHLLETPSADRKTILQPLIDYIQSYHLKEEEVRLNFICTHNSRRSQLAQVWAQTAAEYYNISAQCYSGGVEVTAFNERAVAALHRAGFEVKSENGQNPIYYLKAGTEAPAIRAFSKLYNHPEHGTEGFAAVMTCDHADQHCPVIPGAEKRIAIRYEDPKLFDNTEQEASQYDARSRQIASEMFYVFSCI